MSLERKKEDKVEASGLGHHEEEGHRCKNQLVKYISTPANVERFTNSEKEFLCEFLEMRNKHFSGEFSYDEYIAAAKSLLDTNEDIFDRKSVRNAFEDIKKKTEVVRGSSTIRGR